MFTLFCGGFTADRNGALFDRIAADMAAGRRAFLIVPEQQTVLAEREAAERLPASAPLTFEVTNFSRLANTVFRQVGGVAGTYADGLTKALLMWQVLTEGQAALSRQMRGAVSAGSVTRALAAVKEAQALGIPPDALRDAAGAAGTPGRLRQKLEDLSVLLTLLAERQGEKFQDAEEDTGVMTKKIAEHPQVFRDTAFYIDGFTSFTEPQYVFLEALMKICDVGVALVLPKGAEDAFEFSECAETARRLLRTADLAGVEKRRIFLPETVTEKNALLQEIGRALWHPNLDIDKKYLQKVRESLRIVETKGPHDEASFLASDIRRRVMAGARYGDFAVIMRHAESYRGFADTALAEADIPAFLSRPRDVSSFEAVKLIRAAYRCIAGGFRRGDVLTYAKCSLSGVTREEADDLELYTERWQIDRGGFVREGMWTMNPAGYTDRRAPTADALLHTLHATRTKLMTPLLTLADSARGVHPVREHAGALVRFLCALGLEEALARRAEELAAAGEDDLAAENARLWECICQTLDKLVLVLGDFAVNEEVFSSLLDLSFSSMDIGRIPSVLDEVTLGSADMLRLSGKKHVYLFGVNAGEFPAPAEDNAYFSDRERRCLSDLGLCTAPDEAIRGAREYFIFSRAFAAGAESVTLLYTNRSASFTPTHPAPVVARILELCDGALTVERTADMSPADRVYAPTAGADLLDRHLPRPEYRALSSALRQTGERHAVAVGEGRMDNRHLRLGAEGISLLYPGDIPLTKSIMEMYVKCPFQHFLNYSLKLDDNRKAAFEASNVGTLIHAVLENYLRELTESGTDPASVPDEVRQARVRELAEEHLRRVSAGEDAPGVRRRHLYERLIRTADVIVKDVAEDVSASGFCPAFFELPLGDDDPDLPEALCTVTPAGVRARVFGTIDRVDVLRRDDRVYVRVVDYKTGGETFTRRHLEEGKNLQMFLYLRAVTESERFRRQLRVPDGGEVIPAGVLYVNVCTEGKRASRPAEGGRAAIRAAQSRSGMINLDPEVLAATNPVSMPVRLTRDGVPYASDAGKTFTTGTWQEVVSLVSEQIVRVADAMHEGQIPATPGDPGDRTSPCTYCPYGAVCRTSRGKSK